MVGAQLINAKCMNGALSPIRRCLSLHLLSSLGLSALSSTDFFYFWLCWVYVAALGLSLVVAVRGYSSWQWPGFSKVDPLAVEHGL